jgi:hypothetical protein
LIFVPLPPCHVAVSIQTWAAEKHPPNTQCRALAFLGFHVCPELGVTPVHTSGPYIKSWPPHSWIMSSSQRPSFSREESTLSGSSTTRHTSMVPPRAPGDTPSSSIPSS